MAKEITKNYANLFLESNVLLITLILNIFLMLVFMINDVIATKNYIDLIISPIMLCFIIMAFIILIVHNRINGKEYGISQMRILIRESLNDTIEYIKPIYNASFKTFYFFHFGVGFICLVEILSYVLGGSFRTLISAILYMICLFVVVGCSLYNHRKYEDAMFAYNNKRKYV